MKRIITIIICTMLAAVLVATAALTIRAGGDSYSIEDRLREFLK